jgi:hypothetical protein
MAYIVFKVTILILRRYGFVRLYSEVGASTYTRVILSFKDILARSSSTRTKDLVLFAGFIKTANTVNRTWFSLGPWLYARQRSAIQFEIGCKMSVLAQKL